MWFAPGRDVDLAAYNRFVLYARGEIPSFTLVVKDRHADPQGKTDAGVADFLVSGVSGKWQRFELPFDRFVPRISGNVIHWNAINHVGVAIIAGKNPASGTFQIDNLQVLASD